MRFPEGTQFPANIGLKLSFCEPFCGAIFAFLNPQFAGVRPRPCATPTVCWQWHPRLCLSKKMVPPTVNPSCFQPNHHVSHKIALVARLQTQFISKKTSQCSIRCGFLWLNVPQWKPFNFVGSRNPPFPLGTQAIPPSWTFCQYSPAKTHPKNQPIVWEQLSFRFNLWDLALNLIPEIIGKTLG